LKKCAVILLFFLAGTILHAQSLRETQIFVPPIDGIGAIEDMAYFYKKITAEITSQYRTLGKTRGTSDYVITGRLMPIAELSEEEDVEMPPDSESDEFILFVEMFDNALGEVISTQYITYVIPDETTDESLSVIIYNMLSAIPDLLEGMDADDAWRHKWIYVDFSFVWVPKVYTGTYQSLHSAGVGAELLGSVHFLSFLAVKIGAEVSQDWVVTYTAASENYMDMVLDFPVLVAFVWRPGKEFMLEPYLGVNANVSLMQMTRPYLLSWTAGFQLNVRAGIGILTVDPRFTMDFGRSYVRSDPSISYWRHTVHLAVGYKLGFINRNRQ